MNQKTSTLNFLIIFCFTLFAIPSFSGEFPDDFCTVDLPPGMPEDTLYLADLPNGMVGSFYDESLSFRMPKTTTPVNEIDPDIPAGLTIDQITILSLSNLPPGISWEANQTSYEPATETDGCFRFSGTPLQPGVYLIEVTVEATILVFSQEAVFFIEMIVDPSTSITEGFTMLNNTGCGEVSVSFENNIPSNGEDGFSYQWNFGNGNSSLDENPANQTYSEPGFYIVNYEAQIDTVGYILTRAVITGVTCNDIPTAPDWSTKPDMHIEIRDPSGNLVYTSETVWNTDPPVEYFPNIELLEGNYEIKAIDTDSGINGGDDLCGTITFNQLSNGPVLTGGFNMHLDIIHPVEVIQSSDTVWVFEEPDAPTITDIGATSFCSGDMVVLSSSYDEGNQWLLDGASIVDAIDSEFEVLQSGEYSVVYTNEFGCSAESEPINLEFFDLPEAPSFENTNNLLSLLGSIDYPGDFTFQWYQNNLLLNGETDQFYCALEDGEYILEVTDPVTGCVNTFSETIVFDPQAECFTGTEDLAENWNLQVFPNPVFDVLNISFESQNFDNVEIMVYDLFGRRHFIKTYDPTGNFAVNTSIDLSDLIAGMYLLELKSGDQRITYKFVKK